MVRKICLALALLVPGISHAQDWRITSLGNQNKSLVLVDIATIVTDTQYPRADVLTILSEDVNGTAAVEVNMEFDCDGNRRHGRSAIMYDVNFGIRGRAGVEGQWNEILPHTIYTRVKELICRGGTGADPNRFNGMPSIPIARQFMAKRAREEAEAARREKEAEGKDPLSIPL